MPSRKAHHASRRCRKCDKMTHNRGLVCIRCLGRIPKPPKQPGPRR